MSSLIVLCRTCGDKRMCKGAVKQNIKFPNNTFCYTNMLQICLCRRKICTEYKTHSLISQPTSHAASTATGAHKAVVCISYLRGTAGAVKLLTSSPRVPCALMGRGGVAAACRAPPALAAWRPGAASVGWGGATAARRRRCPTSPAAGRESLDVIGRHRPPSVVTGRHWTPPRRH